MFAARAAVNLVKLVLVADDDIDMPDPVAVEWALGAWMKADRDLVVVTGFRADPAESARARGCGAEARYRRHAHTGRPLGTSRLPPRRGRSSSAWRRAGPPAMKPAACITGGHQAAKGMLTWSQRARTEGADPRRPFVSSSCMRIDQHRLHKEANGS
jgi:hypothetical protein